MPGGSNGKGGLGKVSGRSGSCRPDTAKRTAPLDLAVRQNHRDHPAAAGNRRTQAHSAHLYRDSKLMGDGVEVVNCFAQIRLFDVIRMIEERALEAIDDDVPQAVCINGEVLKGKLPFVAYRGI